MKKRNLKDHLNDDCLDLSLCDLQDVPVKEIAAIPRVTNLDLSNNKLLTLGLNFAPPLVHLVKLDLCRNQLNELPQNFGLLVNLKHLDLYNNQLHTLPLSFACLKSLRWLDLKGNPLVPSLAQVSGPCLDGPGCQFAARNIVRHLTDLNGLLEASKEKARIEQQVKRNPSKHSKSCNSDPNPILTLPNRNPEKLELKEQALKKEVKQKKKKKKKANSKSTSSNLGELKVNGIAIVEEAPVEMPVPPKSSRHAPTPSWSFTKTVRSTLIWTLHFIALSLLLLVTGLFVGSILDQAFNYKISKIFDPYVHPVKTRLPQPVKVLWTKGCSIFYLYFRHVVTSAVALFGHSVRTVISWSVFISTNPTIRSHLSTLGSQLYGYVLKILVCMTDSLNNLIVSLSSLIK